MKLVKKFFDVLALLVVLLGICIFGLDDDDEDDSNWPTDEETATDRQLDREQASDLADWLRPSRQPDHAVHGRPGDIPDMTQLDEGADH